MKLVEHQEIHNFSTKNLFQIDGELSIAKQIQEEKLKLESKLKKEGLRQSQQLRNILIYNDEENKKIEAIQSQNNKIARQIQENLGVDNELEDIIKKQQDKIQQLREEFQKVCELKHSLQDQSMKIKSQRKIELLNQQNINKLLVKYTRMKFGEINENYIFAYYLTNDEQTIPICLEREKQKVQNAQANGNQERVYKTNEEIAEELHARIEDIQLQNI